MSFVARFFIPGKPVAASRPRFARGRVYIPKKVVAWQDFVRLSARPHRPSAPISGAVSLRLVFTLPLPKRAKKSLLGAEVVKRPDIDNLAKSVMDGLSEFWGDDSQVYSLHACKLYAAADPVGVTVAIREM